MCVKQQSARFFFGFAVPRIECGDLLFHKVTFVYLDKAHKAQRPPPVAFDCCLHWATRGRQRIARNRELEESEI